MTRKDYELIAYAVKLSKPEPAQRGWMPESVYLDISGQWEGTAECIADALQGENPRFDRARFLAACGVES